MPMAHWAARQSMGDAPWAGPKDWGSLVPALQNARPKESYALTPWGGQRIYPSLHCFIQYHTHAP